MGTRNFMMVKFFIILSVLPLIFNSDLNYAGLFVLLLCRPGSSFSSDFKLSSFFRLSALFLFIYVATSLIILPFLEFTPTLLYSSLRAFLFSISLLVICSRSLSKLQSRFFLNSLCVATTVYSTVACYSWISNPVFRSAGLGFKQSGRDFLPGWPQYYPLLILFVCLLLLVQIIFKLTIFQFRISFIYYALASSFLCLFITLTRSLLLPFAISIFLVSIYYIYRRFDFFLSFRISRSFFYVFLFSILVTSFLLFFGFTAGVDIDYFSSILDFERGGGGSGIQDNARLVYWSSIISSQSLFSFLFGNFGHSTSSSLGISAHSEYFDFFQRFGLLFTLSFWIPFVAPLFLRIFNYTFFSSSEFNSLSIVDFAVGLLTFSVLVFSCFNNSLSSPSILFAYFLTLQSLRSLFPALPSHECKALSPQVSQETSI